LLLKQGFITYLPNANKVSHFKNMETNVFVNIIYKIGSEAIASK